jgi:hypothetical protein
MRIDKDIRALFQAVLDKHNLKKFCKCLACVELRRILNKKGTK